MITAYRHMTERCAQICGVVGAWDEAHQKFMTVRKGAKVAFDPLEDDGEALRLGIARGLTIKATGRAVSVHPSDFSSGSTIEFYHNHQDDSDLAARVAIVRCIINSGVVR